MKRLIDGRMFDVEVSFVPGGGLGGRVRAIVFREGKQEISLTAPQDHTLERSASRLHFAPLIDDVTRKMRYRWDELDAGTFARFCPEPECQAVLYVTSEQIAKAATGRCPNDHVIIVQGAGPEAIDGT